MRILHAHAVLAINLSKQKSESVECTIRCIRLKTFGFVELQQLTQHLHESVVERNDESKMLVFLHRLYFFLRRPVRMLRDLGEIGATDHHLNTKVIEDSGSFSAPHYNLRLRFLRRDMATFHNTERLMERMLQRVPRACTQ